MLVSLYLKNFRRFDEASATFSAGLNGIFGANYQGKSTLLLAIAVAIAGPRWALKYNLCRRGTENFEIQLVVQLGGRQYRITRTKTTAKLHDLTTDKLLAAQQGNVNIELGKLLGMPVDRWLELRFVRQKQAATMFEAGAAKLNTLVEELTGVRTVSLVIEDCTGRAKTLQAKLDALLEQLLSEDAHEQLKRDLADATTRATALQGEVAELQPKEDDLSAKRDKVYTSLEQNRVALRDGRHGADQLKLARRDIAKAKAALAELPEPGDATAAELEEQAVAAEAEMTSANELANELARAKENHEIAADAMNEASDVCSKARDKVKENPLPVEALDQHQADSEQWAIRRTRLEAERDSLSNEILDIEEALEGGICTSCNRPLEGDDASHREAMEAKLAAVKNAEALAEQDLKVHAGVGEEIAARGQALKPKVEAHNKAVQELAAADAKHDALDQNWAKTCEALQKAQDAAKDQTPAELRAKADDARQRRDGARAAAQTAANLERDRARLDRELAAGVAAEQKWADYPSDEALAALEKKVEEESAELARLKQEIQGVAQLLRDKVQQLQDAQRLEANVQKSLERQGLLVTQVADMQGEVTDLAGFVKYLRDNRSRYLQNAWELILGRASSFADSVTNGWITEIRRTDDGSFVFIENGEEAQVSDSSGAQSALLGIGVQVALSETLPTSLDVFLADEPTADMDADHSSAALMSLASVSKQALVISHHRMDESICAEVMEL